MPPQTAALHLGGREAFGGTLCLEVHICEGEIMICALCVWSLEPLHSKVPLLKVWGWRVEQSLGGLGRTRPARSSLICAGGDVALALFDYNLLILTTQSPSVLFELRVHPSVWSAATRLEPGQAEVLTRHANMFQAASNTEPSLQANDKSRINSFKAFEHKAHTTAQTRQSCKMQSSSMKLCTLIDISPLNIPAFFLQVIKYFLGNIENALSQP